VIEKLRMAVLLSRQELESTWGSETTSDELVDNLWLYGRLSVCSWFPTSAGCAVLALDRCV